MKLHAYAFCFLSDSDPSLLLNLGLLHNWLGDTASAAARFTQLLATPGLPVDRRLEALNHRCDINYHWRFL